MGKPCRAPLLFALALLWVPSLFAQVIEFESNGLQYQTLTRGGLTVMFTELPRQVKNYSALQVAVSNGSSIPQTIRPEDFRFERADGSVITPTAARAVVDYFLQRGGRDDVIKLVGTYEMGLYGLTRFTSTNGYEVRRQNALAEVSSSRLKAAAAASAIVLVATKLKSGESTDGAIFFRTEGKPLGAGKLVATAGGEKFVFEIGGDHHPRELIPRQ